MTIATASEIGLDSIDVDVHIAPSSVADLVPYLSRYWIDYFAEAEIDQTPSAGASYPPAAGSTGGSPGSRIPGSPPDRLEVLRQDFLDASGSSHAIVNCVSSFASNRNPHFQTAIARAINDWTRTEWLASDERLRGSIVVSSADIKAAVAEIDRLGGDDKFVQVLLPSRGENLLYGNIHYRDIFEAADRNGLVVALHAWGRHGSAPMASGFTNTYIDDYLLNSQVVVQEQVVSLITEGVFDQFPELHVSLLECGFTWLPSLLMRFERDWKSLWREVPWMQHEPTHYIYENMRASTEPAQLPSDPALARQILNLVRAGDFLMYASDYPHNHGPGLEVLLGALTEEETSAVLRGNAREFYRLGA